MKNRIIKITFSHEDVYYWNENDIVIGMLYNGICINFITGKSYTP